MTTNNDPASQAVALLAESPTDQLVEMAQMLDGQATLTAEERQTLVWINDAILRRHPEIDAVLDAWVMSDDLYTMTYTEALRAALNGRTW